MITGAQVRSARFFLDLSREQLAKKAKISPETIKNYENGTFTPSADTEKSVIQFFADQGIEFVSGGMRSVKRCEVCGRP